MRILLIHRYFWPDNAPYAQMLYKIAQGLSDAGYEVSVLTALPSHSWDNTVKVSYSETSHGIKIKRLPLLPEFGRKIFFRIINTGLFALQIFFRLLFRQTDVVMVASTPPVIIAAIVRYASKVRGFQYIYHCQDIHPEAMLLAGVIKKGFFYNLLQNVDSKNVNCAAATVVLSEDMEKTLIEREKCNKNIHIINNFIFENIQTDNPDIEFHRAKFTILFAGNLGRFQGLEKIIDTAKLLQNEKEINFVFLGDGIAKNHLEIQAGNLIDKTVFFLGHRPIHETLGYMQLADIGLISITSGVIDVAYPSKTMMYLSMGLSLLVLVEQDCSLSKFIKQYHLGYVSPTAEPEDIQKTIVAAKNNKIQLRRDKSRINQLAEEVFGEDVTINHWVNLYKQLVLPST